MRTIYRIKVRNIKGEELFDYHAPVHPRKDERLYYRDKTYVVYWVGHILKTTVDDVGENTTLDYIELEVGGC